MLMQMSASTPGMKMDPFPVQINQTGIAWKSDRQKKFGMHNASNFNVDPAVRGGATVEGVVLVSLPDWCIYV